MEKLSATLYRSCNALVIVVLLLGVFPPAQNVRSPGFEPPIGHAQEEATISLEETLGSPGEAAPSPGGPSGRLLATRMAEPGGAKIRAVKLPSSSDMESTWWPAFKLTSTTRACGSAAPGPPKTIASPRPSGGPMVTALASGGSYGSG